MNKVITINLNGTAFQLEEAAYDALRAYLDNAARQLTANPDKDEIVADIEQAIGDKCRAFLNPHKNVVLAREIEQILADMGPVVDSSTAAAGATDADSSGSASSSCSTDGSTGARPPVRPLFRIYEGAMLSGVCNGIGVYFGIDPNLVRVIFGVLACLTLGTMALVYLVLVFVLPAAQTPEDKAAAFGTPSNAQEFIRRAREGYYQTAKNWGDKHARRAWQRQFRQEMRTWKSQFRYNFARHAAGWTPPAPPPTPPGAPPATWSLWAGAPLAGCVKAVLTLLTFFVIVSLLVSHRVFTFELPANVPVWVAILVVLIAYQILAAPFHALRHACWSGFGYPVHPLATLFSAVASVFGILLLVFSVWYLDRNVPEAHEFFQKIPPALHSLFHALRDWWASL